MSLPATVVAVDNLDVIRAGLLSLPHLRPDVVASVTAHAAVDELDLHAPPPDVLVLDYWLGHEDVPISRDLAALTAWAPHVLLYTSEERPARLRAALRDGVDGLALKTDGLDALADTIGEVAQGRTAFSGPLAQAVLDDAHLGARLTDREVEILQLLALGLTGADIARELTLSEKTVQTHAENIRRKYATSTDGSVNRARMIRAAQRDGYIDGPLR